MKRDVKLLFTITIPVDTESDEWASFIGADDENPVEHTDEAVSDAVNDDPHDFVEQFGEDLHSLSCDDIRVVDPEKK
jgi:hypothetical protein